MSTSKTSITLALALMVAGAAPAFAGASEEEAMIRRLAPTESISSQASRVAPAQFSAQPFAGARAYAAPPAPAYRGGREYIGTDPDPSILSQLQRDSANDRL